MFVWIQFEGGGERRRGAEDKNDLFSKKEQMDFEKASRNLQCKSQYSISLGISIYFIQLLIGAEYILLSVYISFIHTKGEYAMESKPFSTSPWRWPPFYTPPHQLNKKQLDKRRRTTVKRLKTRTLMQILLTWLTFFCKRPRESTERFETIARFLQRYTQLPFKYC